MIITILVKETKKNVIIFYYFNENLFYFTLTPFFPNFKFRKFSKVALRKFPWKFLEFLNGFSMTGHPLKADLLVLKITVFKRFGLNLNGNV